VAAPGRRAERRPRTNSKVILSAEATLDLRDVCSHIALHDPNAASRIGKGILEHLQILARFPLIELHLFSTA